MSEIGDNILNSILNKLQGYITEEQRDSEDISEMEYDNVISKGEVESFYCQALSQSLSYCYLVNFPTEVTFVDEEPIVVMNSQFQEGVNLWCAGLIWRKYDIRANDQVEEEGYSVSYGDQLIIDAKKQLQPFIYRTVSFW